jgi:hypothetical protein
MKISKRTTISISPTVEEIFKKFDNMKPNDISFSHYLSIAVSEYIKYHTNIGYPRINDNSDEWKKCIESLNNKELIKTTKKVNGLLTRMREETFKRL